MDQLRKGIGLRAYGQRDPLVEYKSEAFTIFDEMMGSVKNEIACTSSARPVPSWLSRISARAPTNIQLRDLYSGHSAKPGRRPRPHPRLVASAEMWSTRPSKGDGAVSPRPRKSVATSRVPAAAARNTRIAAGRTPENQFSKTIRLFHRLSL